MFTRLISGIVLIFLVVFLNLYTSTFYLTIGVTLLTFQALKEFNAILLGKGVPAIDNIAVLPGTMLPFVAYSFGSFALLPYLLGVFFLFVLSAMAVSKGDFKRATQVVVARTVGLIYLGLTLSFVVLLHGFHNGGWWVLLVFVIVWSNDTFAYLTGRCVGRTKLAPLLSPKKTVEGAVGGLIAGVIAVYLYNRFAGLGLALVEVIGLALVLGIVGLLGDLFESLLKRGGGVKDSGNVIPGHGGVLDRMDSLFFCLPILFYFLMYKEYF